MAFKRVEGHSVLISAKAISPSQMKLVDDILGYYRAMNPEDEATKKRYTAGLIQRKELKSAHQVLRAKLASPYFIAKNQAIQVKGEHGLYDLTRFKVDVKMAKEAEEKAAAEANPETGVPKKKKVAKKKKPAVTTTTPKKEAAPKKESKKKKELAAPAPPDETLPVEPVEVV